MNIIALGHYKRVGKDTFADYVIDKCWGVNANFRVIKRSWAWKLKSITHELYGWAGLQEPEFYETAQGALLREVVLPKIGKSPREIWIDFGTKAVREQVYEETWRDYLLNADHQCDCLIIPDTRFYNEIEGVKAAGGHTIKIVRPGYSPGNNKPDLELLNYTEWDNVIGGAEGTLAELEWWAQEYAEWICGYGPEPRRSPLAIQENLQHARQWELAA